MATNAGFLKLGNVVLLLVICIIFLSCSGGGSDGSNILPSDTGDTGATLQGNVVSVSAASFQRTAVADVEVSIGDVTVLTNEHGEFYIEGIPPGDQSIWFNDIAEYLAENIQESETITLRNIQINGGDVTTEHTGTWIGTAGSTESGSQGQIAFTMIIENNGNSISGTGILGSPDNPISEWAIKGTENGTTASGFFTLDREKPHDVCATDGTFDGTFSGNTLSGTFDEVFSPSHPLPPECTQNNENPEHGTFAVEKQ